MSTLQIEQRIKQLPGYLLPQVMDYVDFLLSKHAQLAGSPEASTSNAAARARRLELARIHQRHIWMLGK